MRRVVQSELLDELPPGDPRAIRSRGDLRRLNRIMGSAGILSNALRPHFMEASARSRPLRLVELGAGDGTLLLRLARCPSLSGLRVQVTLIDRQQLVAEETLRAFAALNWSVELVTTDVFTWLEQTAPSVDIILCNLFLHHFIDNRLADLLRLAAARTKVFMACEPRRGPLALSAARLLWLIACNSITRHDAVVSVRAGFSGEELSTLWPADTQWALTEYATGLFSHCFIACKNNG